jgi:hypothetical protein
MLDVGQYATPAHFTMDGNGNTVVHAPSDSGLQITRPAAMTLMSGPSFLDIEDTTTLTEDSSEVEEDVDFEQLVDNEMNSYYSFLN